MATNPYASPRATDSEGRRNLWATIVTWTVFVLALISPLLLTIIAFKCALAMAFGASPFPLFSLSLSNFQIAVKDGLICSIPGVIASLAICLRSTSGYRYLLAVAVAVLWALISSFCYYVYISLYFVGH
jgi:hypothetical protein